ncbi:uncharacterized protein L3040_007946 [Drepanopeziza brunnea f. sp. 'multigermtubi']|uniref:Uncharacterized protein n=1 Tax=Marssonina brunnea f. sp. multigermtubi (strain MB_m1) TaxID=1072389 RepID=K1W9W8_MARBU|nr:uncharacterized protein MBM_07727 [Drepanopeziza brunnea f. sp. 'multigermtubi' MB_m1]EKD14050.1 hypothetical protein MBM_07727 [Drepanopeziza brunnea f. sp. 'multigermtubi' MB_m1]KAJ5035479.1 hypothetical protein L3040_007946 [Drepanopeziza brunnea f. sp. 'multigermtubi']
MDFEIRLDDDVLAAIREEDIRNMESGQNIEGGNEGHISSSNLNNFMNPSALAPVATLPYAPAQHQYENHAHSTYTNVYNMAPPPQPHDNNTQGLSSYSIGGDENVNPYHPSNDPSQGLSQHPYDNPSTTTYNNTHTQPQPHPYPPSIPIQTSPNTALPHPSTLSIFPQSTLSLSFPPGMAPPPVSIRHKPHHKELAKLDTEYAKYEEVIQDEDRMVGKGRRDAREGEEELRVWAAREKLDEHLKARMGFVALANDRLQAAVGERNSWAFELPEVLLHRTPATFGSRLNVPNRRNPPILGNANLTPSSAAKHLSNGRRKDSGVALGRISQTPLSPLVISGQVDEVTGKGLREWLLSRGKESGTQKKRECRNIAFHDFTPDAHTGNHSNVLLACYSGGGLHERVDAYEIDLPTTVTDPATGQTGAAVQSWLWFLISRPVLTLSPSSYNSGLQLPPNFKKFPIPTSWVVFACPASHVTAYPAARDDSVPYPPPRNPFSIPLSAPLGIFRARGTERESKTVYKRQDYDFSQQGVPIFEFSSAELFPVPSRKRIEFLSVDGLRGWDPRDLCTAYNEQEWKRKVAEWEQSVLNLSKQELKMDEQVGRLREKEIPSTCRGVWWEQFYDGLYQDETKWRRIREAMARGKCRVVVRWAELAEVKPAEEGLGLGAGFGDEVDDALAGIGLGVRLNGGSLGCSSSGGSGRKIKERLGRRKMGAKSSRGELRRRSGLGLGTTSQESLRSAGADGMAGLSTNGHLIGVGRDIERGSAFGGGGDSTPPVSAPYPYYSSMDVEPDVAEDVKPNL